MSTKNLLLTEALAAGVHPGRVAEMREDSTLAEIRAEIAAALAAQRADDRRVF
jgi:hypothetical protein